MPPYHVLSEFCSTPMPSSLTAPQVHRAQPEKVIGYVGVVCSNCLESESRKVICDPNAVNIFRTQHICDPHNIESVNGYLRPKQESLLISKILGLSERVTKTVKEWTPRWRNIPDPLQVRFWRSYKKHYYVKSIEKPV
jgi:hypothetical protein